MNKKSKGIFFIKKTHKWMAYIHLPKNLRGEKRVMKNLGHFLTEDEARCKRKEAEQFYFGEYARQKSFMGR